MTTTNQYHSQITRKSPSMFLFMIDCSGSMADMTLFEGVKMSKAQAVSQIVNMTINEIFLRCKRTEGIYNYFDICIIGYGGDEPIFMPEEVCLQQGKKILTIEEINDYVTNSVVYERTRELLGCNKFVSRTHIKQVVTPISEGHTPMYAAMQEALEVTKAWIKEQKGKECFPPTIFNISDGEATDATPTELMQVANDIKALKTEDGNVLLFNMHIGGTTNSTPILFPSLTKEIEKCGKYAEMLMDMSSDMPSIFVEEIASMKNSTIEKLGNVKAMGYNADMTSLLKMINIGSITTNKIK